MSYLLDTHVVLWLLTDPTRLGSAKVEQLASFSERLSVSAASAWEMAIKQSNGKLALPGPAESWLPGVFDEFGFDLLPITVDDALAVRALPWHHRDPFDRLLVAQAKRRGMTLVTRDPRLAEYGVAMLGV